MNNIYFAILATSKNDADAIAEAHRLAKTDGVAMIEVRRCGTKKLIAHVSCDGDVGLTDSGGTSQSLTPYGNHPAGRRSDFRGEFIQPGIKLTIAQRKQSYYGLAFDGFTVVDRRGVDLGENVYLAVIRRESDKQLFGVPWGDEGSSINVGDYSEEDINARLPIIPLWARTVTVYEGPGRSLASELGVKLEEADEAEATQASIEARAWKEARRKDAQRETARREARHPSGRRSEFQGKFIEPHRQPEIRPSKPY